jgi:hypothetical protein
VYFSRKFIVNLSSLLLCTLAISDIMKILRYLLRSCLAIFTLFCFNNFLQAQTFYDGFTGTGNIGGTGNLSSNNGWTTHSPSTGGGEIPIISGNLSYTGLQASVGNKISLPGNGTTVSRDVNAALSLGTGISVAYYSALINVTDNTQLSTSFDYFMNFGNTSGTGTTILFGRLHIKKNAAGTSYRLGIQNTTGGTPTQTEFASDLAFGTTYLIVVKYDFSGTSNDIATLWVNPVSLGGTEPGGGVSNSSGTATSNTTFASICIRNSTGTPKVEIDEIRAGTTWVSVTPASSVSAALSATPTEITGFTYVYGIGPSTSQSISITGSGLSPTSGSLTINGSTDYEVSSDNLSFGSSAAIGYSGGSLTGVNAYIRLKSGLAVASYNNETVGISGGGASSIAITCSGSVTVLPSPSISVGSISGFGNQAINSVSAEKSYSVSGTNLTANISIAPPQGFEISTGTGTGFIATNPVIIVPSSGTVNPTTIYVRFSPTLIQSYSGIISHSSASASQSVAVSGTGVKPQPSNQATNFISTIPGSSSLTVTWADNDGTQAAGAFLVLANTTGTFTAPVDGVAQADDPILSDGSGRMNVLHGIQTLTWTGLNSSTPYYYAIYPYTNSGTGINYKTSATTPTANASTLAQTPVTYTWQGANNAAWNVATNWTPTRTTPSTNDILQFNDGTIKTVTALQTQTIGRLVVSNATLVNLQSATAVTLSIAGGSGVDLDIQSGSTLNLNGTNAVSIALSAGATGSVSGNMTFSAGAHRLTSAATSGIIFENSSTFTAATGFTGSPFGTTSPFNAVLFATGSTYISLAGGNPFGASLPNSVVVFQAGSLYKVIANNLPAFSGRTYANFELDAPGVTISPVGTSAVYIDNLTITNGTLNFNMTGNPGHSIKGNIYVATGASLNFSPASDGTVNFNGSALQQISGGGSISAAAFSNLVLNNGSGCVLNASITVNGTLTLTNGLFVLGTGNLSIGPTATITGAFNSSAMIVANGSGQLRKEYPLSGGSFTFPVGDNTGIAEYSPATLSFSDGIFATGNFVVMNVTNSKFPSDPNTDSFLNRYWIISTNGITNFICDAQFNYVPADINGTENHIYCVKLDPSPVETFNITNTTLHQLTSNGLTTFGTFTGTQTYKLLNLTLFLEGLYNGGGTMRKSQDLTGDKFPGSTADQVTIELHSGIQGSYSTIVYSSGPVNLNVAGQVSCPVPLIHNSSYYITIKHRNSIETVSALPVSFAGNLINYDLTDALTKVYGNNLVLMSDGRYAIFGGDVTQDGIIDSGDLLPVENDGSSFIEGYIATDVNGDGIIDSGDMTIIDNNGNTFVAAMTP